MTAQSVAPGAAEAFKRIWLDLDAFEQADDDEIAAIRDAISKNLVGLREWLQSSKHASYRLCGAGAHPPDDDRVDPRNAVELP